MKKIIFTILLGSFLNTYAQDVEKMDRKELRLAYHELSTSKNNLKDSLLVKLEEIKLTNNNQITEINNLNQSLSISQKKNKQSDYKINELENTVKSQQEKIKILSAKPLKLNTFSEIPEDFKKSCSMTYAATKQLFKSKSFVLFENFDLRQCLIYFNDKPVYLNFKENKEDANGDFIKVYSNENLTISISDQEALDGGTEYIHVYKALITVIDKDGQEINMHVYGEGGC